ncbi:MAG TPA: DUF3107 domain-containing protein [Beutenbergiaceae bacterium]|nr:DUF3107 domain-containing protein [Beutenbergiaceae bacterium]
MEIRIGVKNVARELTLEVSENVDEIAEIVTKALAKAEKDPSATLDLTGERGRRVIVPVSALGFVDFGGDDQPKVGFGRL